MNNPSQPPDTNAPANEARGPSAKPKRPILVGAGAIAAVLAVLIGILATRKSTDGQVARSTMPGKPAPEIASRSIIDGKLVKLSSYRGKYVLLNFFSTTCVPCVQEHPIIKAFAEKHAKIGDAAVIAVLFPPANKPDSLEFWAKRGGTWPLLDDERAIPDYGVTGIPESFLIGPEGVIRAKITGGVKLKRLEALLAQAKLRA